MGHVGHVAEGGVGGLLAWGSPPLHAPSFFHFYKDREKYRWTWSGAVRTRRRRKGTPPPSRERAPRAPRTPANPFTAADRRRRFCSWRRAPALRPIRVHSCRFVDAFR